MFAESVETSIIEPICSSGPTRLPGNTNVTSLIASRRHPLSQRKGRLAATVIFWKLIALSGWRSRLRRFRDLLYDGRLDSLLTRNILVDKSLRHFVAGCFKRLSGHNSNTCDAITASSKIADCTPDLRRRQ